MNNIDLMNYWIESSDRDYESMCKNFETEQYTWALFIGHLTIEKLFKAVYAKINVANPYPPKIHSLNILAQRCNIDLRIEPHPIKVKDFEEGNPFVQEIIDTGIKVA